MSALVIPPTESLSADQPKRGRRHDPTRAVTSPLATVVAVLIATVWTVPTIGLLITSFRPQADITRSGWWTVITNPDFTLDNYVRALSGSGSSSMLDYFVNSFVITIPSTLFPLALAALAAYGFSWLRFFLRIVLPLATPAIVAYGIFQFLWTWNDLLVSMVFLGGSSGVAPLTVYISQLSGSRGSAWYLLSAGAFISMVIPVAVFLIMQRYFVRGLTAGAVK